MDNQNNNLALASMITGIASIILSCCCCGGFILGIVAIILAILSRVDNQLSGQAMAGLITGIVSIVISVIYTFILIIFMLMDY